MMFSRVAALVLAALPALAAATPVLQSRGGGQGGGSCSTGSMQCCNSVENASSPEAKTLAGLLGIVLDAAGQVGLDCSPISVIGVVAGNNCQANAVCCTNNDEGGLISTGCIPVSL
ncbi:fungal hydrophobin [Lentinus tigrinus ALCF2SS1-7]|uniref:Hydrophobin n=1 Tax=Lentinus tigrinus ALCF2SS1-6 TaxID=1328759 RepID=A0A5C2RYN9_9APHY|nr:fungal hydrophobin [Lentinus tigrinus ALCF2SS1-6]RPD73991.1 fungal hydrophobin [Lentinus tigrinus ALCF2SS1-7]